MKARVRVSALLAALLLLVVMMIYAESTYADSEMITDVEVTLKAPAPGSRSEDAIEASVPDGKGYIFKTAGYDGEKRTFEAGKKYTVWINLEAEPGYYFPDNTIPKVNGGVLTGTPDIHTFDDYSGMTITVEFTCAKKKSPLAVTAKTASVSYSKLKKATQYLKVSKVLTVSNKKGTVSYVKKSGSAKITINKKNGKVTVKKGIKKGTYKVKVTVTDSGNNAYAKGSKTKTFTVRVK